MHRGFFADIPPEEYPAKVAFAIFDSDTERSHRDSFNMIYPRMHPNGTIVIQDYGHDCCPGAKFATEQYLSSHGLPSADVMVTKTEECRLPLLEVGKARLPVR